MEIQTEFNPGESVYRISRSSALGWHVMKGGPKPICKIFITVSKLVMMDVYHQMEAPAQDPKEEYTVSMAEYAERWPPRLLFRTKEAAQAECDRLNGERELPPSGQTQENNVTVEIWRLDGRGELAQLASYVGLHPRQALICFRQWQRGNRNTWMYSIKDDPTIVETEGGEYAYLFDNGTNMFTRTIVAQPLEATGTGG